MSNNLFRFPNLLNNIWLVLLPLVVGLIVGYISRPHDYSTENELERQLKVKELETLYWNKKYDSLGKVLEWSLLHIDLTRDTLTSVRKERYIYMKKYEEAKRTPIRIAGQSQLDSLLRARYP